ncbi:branched-chain amino acid aminotransferase [Fredinandcohnia quinoae]|uniref:Branched-chain amino acid aminotransferase n=1 Tax=Fredinandcohnia quinoae TaxID=2918902 RepID=A0AAW5E2Y0_9BACI|nr:branched-chain amino acid aminotransferase [Fredinandcohnia sp. SECRCQ15]MCH1624447.1 branched-chain amino acid aminotransferase [Fredinandcohnia sp. SECRCQ15]
MLHKQMEKYISSELMSNPSVKKVELYQEEIEYIQKHELIPNDVTLIEKDPTTRFLEAYIERCDKESEETIATESFGFLENSIDYLQKHKNEFLYFESHWFDQIGVDSISFEVNDVFGTYDVMVGLKLQKKFESSLKDNLRKELQGDKGKFELIFNQNDGVWDLNFALNNVKGFQEEMSLEEAYRLIYRFLFTLVERIEGRSKVMN